MRVEAPIQGAPPVGDWYGSGMVTARWLLVVASTLLVLVACGGGGDAESSDPLTSTDGEVSADGLPDPCALVLQEDVDALFQGPAAQGEPGDVTGPGGTSGGRSCSWSKGFDSLHASIFIGPGFLTPIDICENCATIEGYGDEAWGGVDDRGSGGAIMAISVGGLGVQISANGLDATVEQLEPLAQAILAGLP